MKYYFAAGIFALLLGVVYAVLWPVFMYRTFRLMYRHKVSYREARYAVNAAYFVKALELDLEK